MGSRDFEGMLDVCTSTLMTQVRNFTEDQLQTLLNDDSRLNSMVENLSQISALPNDKEMKLAQSKSLAEYNLSIERKLNEAILKLQKTHADSIEAKKEVEHLRKTFDTIAESRSLDSICAMLKTMAQDADDESEKVSDQFKNGLIEIDAFVKQYNEKRALAHIRKLKAEKLTELLNQQQYNPTPIMANDRTSINQPSYPVLGHGYGPSTNYRHSYYS